MSKNDLLKYAAKLLFQFRVIVNGESNKRRTCEERIVLVKAPHAEKALELAKSIGAASEHSYDNSNGNPVHYEFIGVMDLMQLGAECEDNEVWYEIKEYLTPMERSGKFIPPVEKLSAIFNERQLTK